MKIIKIDFNMNNFVRIYVCKNKKNSKLRHGIITTSKRKNGIITSTKSLSLDYLTWIGKCM